jgi:hypothetical protein
VYGGGRTTDRRISTGESSEEWLILGLAVRTVKMVSWKWEYRRVCSIVGVSKADWGCGGWIVEVYKWFAKCISWGHRYLATLHLERLDNNCRGAWECVA